MVALFELLAPVAEAVGLHLTFIATLASNVSHFTALSSNQAEILLLYLVATAILEVANVFWHLLVG